MKEYTAIGKNHDVIKKIKQLKKNQKPASLYLVEDLSTLELAFKENFKIVDFIFCNERTYSKEASLVIDYYLEHALSSYVISNKTFESLASKDNSVGLYAIIEKKEYQLKDIKNDDIILVLDKLENAGNVGTLLRTADACKIKTIFLVDSVVNSNHHKIVQSSRGMILTKQIYDLSYNEAKDYLLKNNYTLYLGEPILGKPYNEYSYEGKVAIIIGSERFGINSDWYNEPHQKVYIPMYGIMTSLNVGIAGGILMYEARMSKEKRKK